jgi:ABC-type lipoprotein export system ATPase subunit
MAGRLARNFLWDIIAHGRGSQLASQKRKGRQALNTVCLRHDRPGDLWHFQTQLSPGKLVLFDQKFITVGSALRWRIVSRPPSAVILKETNMLKESVLDNPIAGAISDPAELPPPIIQAIGLQKIYDTGKVKVHALRGVDLSIRPGEMVAIMGPSGCGKTSLLNCLSGLDDIDEGEITIEGTPISKMSDRQRTRYRAEKMGFVFQSYNLLPVLTAVENVELPLLVVGVRPRDARRRAQEVMELVGLAGQAQQRPAELSGGQQQRVTIGRALVNDPAIVWGDELTGALDSETSAEIMDLVCRLNAQTGQTFVVVTHDPSVAHRAHRLIKMRDGVVESDGINNN